MNILLVHNYYRQPGGEDVVFAAESALLRRYGHDVTEFTADNEDIERMGKLAMSLNTIWSGISYRKLAGLIKTTQPDIVHFHNTFMMISPAGYYACRKAGVPSVQTLHNYRLFCPNAIFYRDNHVCEDCLGKLFPWPGIVHGCYRDSKSASAVVSIMLAGHRVLGKWYKTIERYIVLTEFARDKFARAGLPSDKLVVKPNFLDIDPGVGERSGRYMIFIGRLTREKGVMTLLKAWESIGDIPLKIVGDGTMKGDLQAYVDSHSLNQVELMGQLSREETLALLKDAYCMVFPSEWYEGLPMTIVEAFACGVPVVGSRLGACATIVEHGRTGLHFEPGKPEKLAAAAKSLWEQPELAASLAWAARQEYEQKYTAERNYDLLMQIYNDVIKNKQK